ncbi:MAG: peptide chain release factor-like protein [Planctomycetota bacterium]|nr:peptide chain release factor-like protein [Planctomycetota bacterium]
MEGEAYLHPAALDEEALLAQCEFGSARSSGPGGQHRNKVETKVVLTHRPTGISAQAGERRSQGENKRVAMFRLRLALATQHRETVPYGEIGSALWKSRRQGERIVCNPSHRDYPALLAEALDAIADAKWEPRKPAIRLEVSASQLVKLVKDHPPALAMWNAERAKRKLHALK